MDTNFCRFQCDLPHGVVSLQSDADAQVSPQAEAQFSRWIALRRHASMAYMEKYAEVRRDPRLLLDGARSLIVVAFPYFTAEPTALPFALYARGRDYHEVVRERLSAMAAQLPGQSRVCVDTAPLRERYWAARAGLGFIGLNNQLILPDTAIGSYAFLGSIITTALVEPTSPRTSRRECYRCGRCIAACPAQALHSDGGGVDANRCLSYLTIEHRGDFAEGTDLHGKIYGCDVCQRVCPHNAAVVPTTIADFHPSEALCRLTAADIREMTPEQFSALFRHSAVRRTKLAGLQRNISHQ
jgi:epoxyqueuosine reductase